VKNKRADTCTCARTRAYARERRSNFHSGEIPRGAEASRVDPRAIRWKTARNNARPINKSAPLIEARERRRARRRRQVSSLARTEGRKSGTPLLPRPLGVAAGVPCRFREENGTRARMEARCERRRGRPASASGTTNSGAAAAAAARRPGWSTTRDCAVITAACGRKHVGTRGRGGSPRPLYVSSECARGPAAVAPVCACVERARARRPVGIRAALRGTRVREGRGETRSGIQKRSLPPTTTKGSDKSLSLRFSSYASRGRPVAAMRRENRRLSMDSIDRGDLRGSSGSFPRHFNCRADLASGRSPERRDAVCIVINVS